MSEHSTPGQVAYTAYMAVLALSFPLDFAALPDTYHRAWEAAAQAVLVETRRYAVPVVRHWHEFGPAYGFAEAVHDLERWLQAREEDTRG